MKRTKVTFEKDEISLGASIKTITKNWLEIRNKWEEYRAEIETEYFTTYSTRKELFLMPKYEEELTDEVIKKRFIKHSSAVLNCMETLVGFMNGNEEIKPILYVLGKHHKSLNVNEKMFLEMKDAICKVIKKRLGAESSKAWDIIFQYILINCVFEGMHMVEPF